MQEILLCLNLHNKDNSLKFLWEIGYILNTDVERGWLRTYICIMGLFLILSVQSELCLFSNTSSCMEVVKPVSLPRVPKALSSSAMWVRWSPLRSWAPCWLQYGSVLSWQAPHYVLFSRTNANLVAIKGKSVFKKKNLSELKIRLKMCHFMCLKLSITAINNSTYTCRNS